MLCIIVIKSSFYTATTTGKTAGTSVLNDPTTGIMLCIIFIGSSSYAATTTGKTAGTSELNPPTSTESHHTDTPVFATVGFYSLQI
jgi:hypothetical protein